MSEVNINLFHLKTFFSLFLEASNLVVFVLQVM